MKKEKEIVIRIRTVKEFFEDVRNSYQKALQGEPTARNVLSFETGATFRKSLTKNRMELLELIKKHQPNSIHELAQLSGRNLKTVQDDLKALRKIGLVSLNNGKGHIKPDLTAEKINIQMEI